MALPRPALLGILGALLVAAAFLVSHGLGHSNSSDTPAPPVAAQPKPAKANHAAAKTGTNATAKHAKHAAAAPAKPAKHAVKHSTAKKPASVKVKVPAGQEAGASVGLPASVARAFAKHKIVVLYFGGKGTDDELTADSVRALRASAGNGVAVFMDKLSNLADYRRVVEGLDVSQAPSIVIVDRAHKAQLFEGFIDAGSLRQDVADVTR